MPKEDLITRLDSAEQTSELTYLEVAAGIADQADSFLKSNRSEEAFPLYSVLASRDDSGLIEDLVEHARQTLESLGHSSPKSWKRKAAERIEELPDAQKFLHIARQTAQNFSAFGDRMEQARTIITNFRKAHEIAPLNRKDGAVLRKFESEFPSI